MTEAPPSLLLQGRRVLVTGATSGIGEATARWIACLGGSVVAVGRREEKLRQLIPSLPGEGHLFHVADLVPEASRAALAGELEPCHGVVHAAGALKIHPFVFLHSRTLRELHAINYEAPVLLTQALLKQKKILPGGSVVFITSVAARSGAKGHSAYAGTKAALEASARCLAMEAASRKIRVNCIAPGMVVTAMADEAGSVVGQDSMKEHEKAYPLGFGKPEDIARAAGFLLAEASSWMTGSVMVCDGGFTAGH